MSSPYKNNKVQKKVTTPYQPQKEDYTEQEDPLVFDSSIIKFCLTEATPYKRRWVLSHATRVEQKTNGIKVRHSFTQIITWCTHGTLQCLVEQDNYAAKPQYKKKRRKMKRKTLVLLISLSLFHNM